MPHPQNTPRGLFGKASQINLGAQEITANSTAVLLSGGVRLNGVQTVTANAAKHIVVTHVTAKPAVDSGVAFALVSNSTGVALVVNSTGTTWKYLLTTSVQPT